MSAADDASPCSECVSESKEPEEATVDQVSVSGSEGSVEPDKGNPGAAATVLGSAASDKGNNTAAAAATILPLNADMLQQFQNALHNISG